MSFFSSARARIRTAPTAGPCCRRSAQIIQIDIDPMEIGRTYEADVRISADARASLEALAARLRDLWPEHRRGTRRTAGTTYRRGSPRSRD